MTDKIIYVAHDSLVPHPDNPRLASEFKKSHPKMAELIASVASLDLLQPIVARPHPTEAGKRQIVLGHRRWYACGYAGKDKVPVIAKDYDDVETLAAQAAENINRENPDPILEARTIATWESKGFSLKDIAERFGKSHAWAVKRAQIAKLTDDWQERAASGDLNWPLEHYARIARYEPHIQAELLERIGHWPDVSADALDRELSRYMRAIAKTPWDADDAELLPEAGACTACAKRSSCQGLLFDDLAVGNGKKATVEDRCTDVTCWQKKEEAHLAKRIADVRAKHPQAVKLTDSWGNHGDAIGQGSVEACKKGDKGAVPAIRVDGPRVGTLTWVKTREGSRPAKALAAATPGATAPGEDLATKRAALAKRRTLWTWDRLNDVLAAMPHEERYSWLTPAEAEAEGVADDPVDEADAPATADAGDGEAETPAITLPTGKIPSVDRLVAWIVLYGVSHMRGNYEQALACYDRIDASAKVAHAALWAAVHGTMTQELQHVRNLRMADSTLPDLIAKLIRVDLDALRQAADTAIPEPKAWRKQYPDQYPADAA